MRVNVELGGNEKTIRAADAKEVGVGNPAEETYRYPNQILQHNKSPAPFVNSLSRLVPPWSARCAKPGTPPA